MRFLKINHSSLQNIILSFLLISGALKPFFVTYIANLDITLLMLFVVITDIIYTSKKNIKVDKNKIIFILSLLLFYTIIIFSLAYSKSPRYGYFKSAYFGVNLIYFIYPLFVKEIKWHIIYKTLTLTILPLSIWYIIYRYFYWTQDFIHLRFQKEGFYHLTSSYLGIGLFLGIGILINYFLKYNRFVFWVYLITLVLLGARGSLVFTLLIIMGSKFYQWWLLIKKRYPVKLSQRNIILFLIVFFSSLPLYMNNILQSHVFRYGIMRLKSFLNISSDGSSLERIERITFALKHTFETPLSLIFGHGIGSYGIMYTNLDQREYPHNIYVESLFELGIIGLSIILFISLIPFFLKRNRLFKILVFFLLLSAQKTSSLSDLWVYFFFLGILIFNPKVTNRLIK